MNLRLPLSFSLLLVLLLAACETADNESNVPDSAEADEPEAQEQSVADEQPLEDWEIEFQRQRLLGDLLYDALRALEEDRLLTPIDDNAHARYQRVLAIDPDNQLAREGLRNIVARYLELAQISTRQGRFASAQTLLDRARFVDRDDPAIRVAQRELEADMNSGDLIFMLDGQELARQSQALVAQLEDIARQAVEHGALAWITAPSDAQGRWIYGVMRESVDGYRLRANIELGSHAIVRLRKPALQDGTATPVPGSADTR